MFTPPLSVFLIKIFPFSHTKANVTCDVSNTKMATHFTRAYDDFKVKGYRSFACLFCFVLFSQFLTLQA